MNSDEISKLAEQHVLDATRIIHRVILKLPEDVESNVASKLVEHIVSAAILELSAVQKAAMEERNDQHKLLQLLLSPTPVHPAAAAGSDAGVHLQRAGGCEVSGNDGV